MKNSSPLGNKRKTIDSIDSELLALLNKRAAIAVEIGKIKEKNGDDIFSSAREREILERLTEESRGPLSPDAVEDIFQSILTSCRSLQKHFQVAFFGPEATFTHQLALKHFGTNCGYTPVPSIKDVFREVEMKRADYGVVPVENSTEGIVNHTLDMFVNSELVIVAEREEPITENLFSSSGNLKSVKSVYSHPQPLAQCREWLDTHLPGVAIHEAASTADASIRATLDPSVAAIASALAGKLYNLKAIATKIEDSADNMTRFLIIGRAVTPPSGHDKTSILFSVKDRVGALYEMLKPFRKAGLNLTKIESRPTKRKAWEYIFFVDFIGHHSEKRVQKALAELQKNCTRLKILGSYPFIN